MRIKKGSKYKLKIYDEAHLIDRGGFSLSWWKLTLFGLVFIAFFIAVGIGIVWFTPIKKRLPGYMVPEQRDRTEEAFLRVDSLHKLYAINQAYMENLMKVLDTERDPDMPDTLNGAIPFIPESLLEASEAEKEFVRKMAAAGYIVELPNDETTGEDE